MRLLPFFLVLCLAFTASGNPVFHKLAEVNKCWTEQADIAEFKLPDWQPLDEIGWIKLHLTLVEQRLRQRSTNHLSENQKQNRAAALDHLHEYLLAGSFPQNEDYSYRTPIFIDKYDNFCAVGYLVKATGFEQVSRMIASETNLAYVRQMNYPELNQWAEHFGFTRDELAWIQPGYAPNGRLNNIGGGTNGIVNELYVDTTTEYLYVGGAFTEVDSTINTENIAYVTEQNGIFTWHGMGAGFNGPVHAITKHGNRIFAAGSFTASGSTILSNVAAWDGNAWQAAGCVDGLVKDLVVFEGTLYAAGNFDACGGGPADVNFAKWDGNAWIPIPGVSGTINTMEAMDSILLLGGNFTFGTHKNVAKWHPNTGFDGFGNDLNNEVTDFENVYGVVYSTAKHTVVTDSAVLNYLTGNTWTGVPLRNLFYKSSPSLNTICVDGSTSLVGGDFDVSSIVSIHNSFNFQPVSLPYHFTPHNHFNTDSTINKMVAFKSYVIVGGKFTKTKSGIINLNGIGQASSFARPLVAFAKYSQYMPCQFADTSELLGIGVWGYPPYTYKWSTGDSTETINVLSQGEYTLEILDSRGTRDTTVFRVMPLIADTAVTANNGFLLFNNPNNQYEIQWVDCENNYAPVAAPGQEQFIPERRGHYAVIIKRDSNAVSCTDTTACYYFSPTGIKSHQMESSIGIHPNPAKDFIQIDLGGTYEQVQVVLTDLTGKTLMTQSAEQTDRVNIDIAHLPPGMYTLKISDGVAESRHFKIVKE